MRRHALVAFALPAVLSHRQYVDQVPNGDIFVEVWKACMLRHPDMLPAVADGILSRRAELSKQKADLSKACTRAHSAAQAEAMKRWAKDGVGDRPGQAQGPFSTALSGLAAKKPGASSKWFGQ